MRAEEPSLKQLARYRLVLSGIDDLAVLPVRPGSRWVGESGCLDDRPAPPPGSGTLVRPSRAMTKWLAGASARQPEGEHYSPLRSLEPFSPDSSPTSFSGLCLHTAHSPGHRSLFVSHFLSLFCLPCHSFVSKKSTQQKQGRLLTHAGIDTDLDFFQTLQPLTPTDSTIARPGFPCLRGHPPPNISMLHEPPK